MSGISPQDFPQEWEEIDEEIDLAEIESTVAPVPAVPVDFDPFAQTL